MRAISSSSLKTRTPRARALSSLLPASSPATTKVVFFDTGKNSRLGEDYRHGRDVGAEDFMNEFGFRGVQFGNWTNQDDRQMAEEIAARKAAKRAAEAETAEKKAVGE